MTIFKVVIFGIISSILAIILKEQKTDFSFLVTLIASILICIFVFAEIKPIFELVNELVQKSGINMEYMKIILKLVGVSYIVEFGKNVCLDSGQSSIASKIEMAGKVVIVSLSIPVITSLVELVSGVII